MSHLHDEEARRIAELLDRLVRLSGRSRRSIERDLGLGSSGLSKILGGTVRLQLGHVLMIVEALGVQPWEFFRWAYPSHGRTSPLMEKVRDLTMEDLEEEDSPEFDDRVKRSLLRLLREDS